MTYSVVVSAKAENDISSIVDYIGHDNPNRARTFVAELREWLERKLSTFPYSGVAVGAVRYLTFGNYVIVYKLDESARIATVVMVSEGHRDWRRILDV